MPGRLTEQRYHTIGHSEKLCILSRAHLPLKWRAQVDPKNQCHKTSRPQSRENVSKLEQKISKMRILIPKTETNIPRKQKYLCSKTFERMKKSKRPCQDFWKMKYSFPVLKRSIPKTENLCARTSSLMNNLIINGTEHFNLGKYYFKFEIKCSGNGIIGLKTWENLI